MEVFQNGYLPRRIEDREGGNRTLNGRTPEGTILQIRMMLRTVMMQMVRRGRQPERGTQLHLKRGAAGRHEADGYVGTKQQRGQHDDGRKSRAAVSKGPVAHTLWAKEYQRPGPLALAHR